MMETELTEDIDQPLRDRLKAHPGPALLWGAGLCLLLLLEGPTYLDGLLGAIGFGLGLLPGAPGAEAFASASAFFSELPHLLSRELIPNRGYYDGSAWQGTFLGLEPKYAWLIRFLLVYVYVAVLLGWLWYGYVTFRRHYRAADWTPTDDVIDRLRSHYWGLFGLAVVVFFITMAAFAPVVGPTTAEENIEGPYSHDMQYYDADTETVETITIGEANLGSASRGSGDSNVGIWSYDDFGRFHPVGTLVSGKDLFTFLAFGARVSLFIGLGSMAIAGFIATTLALVTAYYKGVTDLIVVLTSDSVQAMPALLLVILATVVFKNHWIAELYNGAMLFILLFALIRWPGLWRAVRGPALQVGEQEWVDAARSYGQRPTVIMRKHMAPYILGYLLVYASLTLGGVIISVSALSFLGLGITAPTPEWGRAINIGQSYIASQSWHISLIPGILITLVVTGFNALSDGIRDAIDPQSEGAEGGATGAAAGGGGG
ncbi:peptide/nickel transport system permease protein [Haloarcula quadrata]|uniref:Peptide/nickel transport system permease protein n=2 Tax=Haloarcula quadrata TaxID=182779 RepID=A0A495R9U6_9EURY|nr:peptide/nickel transport system permease protein [Haloarcula quadrata]